MHFQKYNSKKYYDNFKAIFEKCRLCIDVVVILSYVLNYVR